MRPDRQRQGIGQALIKEGLARLKTLGAQGCVLLGSPQYYGRFGFRSDADLHLPGVPPEYFQRLAFTLSISKGTVSYNPAFDTT